MTPTRPRTLLLIGVIALGVTWALLTVVYASLPPLTWTLVPALLIGAALEAWTGRDLRARIQGRRGRAAGAAAVRRADGRPRQGELAGGRVAGRGERGVHGLPVGDDRRADPARRPGHASLSFGASVVLLAAALFLEYCCRVPNDPRADRDEEPPPPRPSPFDH